MMWRGVIAGATNIAMGTGVYPILPAAGAHWVRRRRGMHSRLHLRATAKEWGASLAGTLVRPVGFLGELLRPDRGQRPVVLVHGYAMNRACFLTLSRRLAEAGYGPIYGFEYWSLGKVSSAARQLHRFVEELCQRHGCEQVDLVGHSMGGLVSRYYLTLGPGRHRGRVAHLITIGTPHGGTVFSAFGLGRAQIELRPRTPFFVRMGAAPLPKDTRITVIWSHADSLVGIAEHARWRGCEEVVYQDLGHVAMLYSRRVAAEIITRLRA